jgi:hypothetical protein
MAKLNEEKVLRLLGFEKGWIIETITCTYNEDNTPNAAPMGATTNDFKHVILKPFVATQTFKNICRTKECTISMVKEPLLFFKFTFKDKQVNLDKLFEKAKGVNAPKLKDGYACLELRAKNFDMEGKNRAKVTFEIVNFHDSKIKLRKGYNRAEHALMESIIHATRIKIYLSEGKFKLANDLISLVNHYSSLCKKVAPNSDYCKAMQEITKNIENWRKLAKP